MPSPLYNGIQLASALGKSPTYVTAMKHAGYEFTHGTMTTLESAHAWLAAFPQFRACHYLAQGADVRLPNLRQTPDQQTTHSGNKSECQHWESYLRNVPSEALLQEMVRRSAKERARENARERQQRFRWRQVRRKAAGGAAE